MKRRRNPTAGDHVMYWVAFGGLVVFSIAVWAWKAMTDKQRASVLPVGSTPHDIEIGGPWVMLDVEQRGKTKDSRSARENVPKGAIVAVLLNAGGAKLNMPYIVSVLGSSGRIDLPLTGTWALAQPPAGPQAIDFGPEHIFLIS